MSINPSVGSILIADQLGGSPRIQTQLQWMITLANHQNNHNLIGLKTQFKVIMVMQ